MKRFHRRCRWLCILAALLVLLVLFLRQNVLLDTASRHAILLDVQSGRVLAQKRADERAAPASLTKMMTVLLAVEAMPDLDTPVTLPEDIFPPLVAEGASMVRLLRRRRQLLPQRVRSELLTLSVLASQCYLSQRVRQWHVG